ncbi:MAG: hypothetical protein JSS49_06585 [Planctomycetes bacterium]|nr:hypothetical protein [Planctomycetota bacterium]
MSSIRLMPASGRQHLCTSALIACAMLTVLFLSSFATAKGTKKSAPPPPPPPPAAAVPLDGLTPDELDAFDDGLDDFQEAETPGTGLGPIFNRESCAVCHSGPAVGGSSAINATRFGRVTNGFFDPLESLGGSLLQERAISQDGLEKVPRQANITAKRQTPPLFGFGLIEAIPDNVILKGVRTTAVDGVLGKASLVQDVVSGTTRVGRFGWKAQQATLLAFAGDAYLNEMGITNRLFPTENAPNGNIALLKKLDKVADPEDQVDPATGKAGIDKVADFMRFLAPLPPQPTTPSTVFGAKFFLESGCAACHTPSLTTGPSPVAALSNKTVNLYSDLLLHDMGKLGDGIVQGNAGPREMRTAPLWGVGASAPYLHDGRATTLDQAIRAHDGEAKVSVGKYLKLKPDQQKLLAEFLKSL